MKKVSYLYKVGSELIGNERYSVSETKKSFKNIWNYENNFVSLLKQTFFKLLKILYIVD